MDNIKDLEARINELSSRVGEIPEDKDVMESYVDNLPRWLFFSNSEFNLLRAVFKQEKKGGEIKLEELKSKHDVWASEFLDRLSFSSANEEFRPAIEAAIKNTDYLDETISGWEQTTLLSLINLANPGRRIQNRLDRYEKLVNQSAPFQIVDIESKMILESTADILTSLKYLVSRKDDLLRFRHSTFDILRRLNISPYNLKPAPEALVMQAIGCEIDKSEFFGYFQSITGLTAESDQGCEDKYHWRAEKLKQGNLFVKPAKGAGADLVMRLSYKDGKLVVESQDEKLLTILEIAADKELLDEYKKAQEKDCADNDDLDEEKFYDVYGQRKEELSEDLVLEVSYGSVSIMDKNRKLYYILVQLNEHYETINNLPLQGHNSVRKDDRIEFEVDDLEQALTDLDQVFDVTGSDKSYAEREIRAQNIRNNQTWELRVINQAVDLENSVVTAMYAKVGESSYVANISKNGTGDAAETVVREAYQRLRPGEDVEDLVDDYILRVRVKARESVEAAGEYLTLLKDQKRPDFPLERVVVTDCSTDFNADIVETPDGLVFEPILTDLNFSYGFTGLNDECAENLVRLNKAKIERNTIILINGDLGSFVQIEY